MGQELLPSQPTANVNPTAGYDGVAYCTSVPIVSSEADLGDGLKTPNPIAVEYGTVISAIVQLSINGYITGNSTFVFMQTDMGDGVWVDVGWVFFNQVMGSATFVIDGGVIGTTNNVFQQTRNPGSAPATQASGSNPVPLMGRVRFTGFSNKIGGSSSAPGTTTQVTATIKYKLQAPR